MSGRGAPRISDPAATRHCTTRRFVSRPSPSISTETTSPAFNHCGFFSPNNTPSGVPVAIRQFADFDGSRARRHSDFEMIRLYNLGDIARTVCNDIDTRPPPHTVVEKPRTARCADRTLQISARRNSCRPNRVRDGWPAVPGIEILAMQRRGIGSVNADHFRHAAGSRFAPQMVSDFRGCGADVVSSIPCAEDPAR